MARKRINKKINIVDLSTAPDELPQVGGVQKTVDRELNAVEPSEGKISNGLNQGEELNPLEINSEKISNGLNQGEELNPLEINSEKISNGLNQGEELNPLEINSEKISNGLNQGKELNPLEINSEKISNGLNQGEELNPLEINSEKISNGLNQETKRRGARGKQLASGCLHSYTKNIKLKSGIIATYPKVEGNRDPDNIYHWYWGYKYEVKINGDWKTRTLPVSRFRVITVRYMIFRDAPVDAIKALIKGEFAND